MSAPLPWAGTVGSPFLPAPRLEPSQAYPNTNGLLGVYQSSGAVLPASNAFFQSLGTNGRSCFSCHRPSDGMSLNTNTIRMLYMATAGRDPLFAPVDGANCPSSVPHAQTYAPGFGGRYSARYGGAHQSSSNEAHSLLLNKGLFRIFLPVPQHTPDLTAVGGPPSHPVEFTISVVSDPYGCNTDPAYAQQVDPVTQEKQQMISVYRRPRMSANLKFMTTPSLTLGSGRLPNVDIVTGVRVVDPSTGAAIGGNIMWDGREPTLESQARNATLGHAQALKPPTDAQIAQIVAFEKSVFAAQSYNVLAGNLTPSHGSTAFGGPKWMSEQSPAFAGFALFDAWPTTHAGAGHMQKMRASIARGQALFNTRAFSVSNVAGFNNAAVLRATNPSTATCVSCHGNLQAGSSPLSAALRDIGTGGHATQFGGPAPSKDLPIFRITCKAPYTTLYYGKEVLTNDPGQALITGRCSDIGRKSVPQLRALASRAPYFSDGSAATVRDTVMFYDKRFGMGLTNEEIDDLTNFMNSL
ncbi:MAG: hypothetical protein JF606_17205 [Burkholderiales bacterium]|nr:hypothetical protein [Burkholderiales bacterium]